FKVANITGQIHNTRARGTQQRIDDKVCMAALQYCRARDALLKLRGKGLWEDSLKVLEQSDVRALNERELTAQEKEDVRMGWLWRAEEVHLERVLATVAAVGEGQHRPSWIWFTGSVHEDADDPLTRAALRVEWAKAKVRADRWEEEVVLLDEEMRRVLEFCRWKVSWWAEQVPRREALPAPLAEGLKAYAAEQADMEHRISLSWTAKW
ncbi:hypothetical protein PILCRDRAFT_24708, partial [Piloderma croceum F 1598]